MSIRHFTRELLLLAGVLASFAAHADSRVITVSSSETRALAVISGTVTPYREVTLTAQLPGRVQLISGFEGDRFNQGDLLLSLEVEDLMAKRKAAEAQLGNARSSLQNAQVQYSRELYSPQSESIGTVPGMGMPKLFDNLFTRNMGDVMGYGNPALERHADLYSRATGINQAQAMVLQTEAQIRELDAKMRDSRSIAPFDGVILKKMVEVGDTVQPGMPLLSFAHIKYMRVQSEVPARLASQLYEGMMLNVRLDNDVATKARVAQVYPMADASNHTVTVKFDLPEGTLASPGMYAELVIPDMSADNQQVVIPRTALIRGRSLPAVLLVENNSSTLRLVRLGQEMGDGTVIVLSGLMPGQQIVDNPPSGVKSGWLPGQVADKSSAH
jgi:multidrug efflux pump subunit AcrA (membrane-fusion protein)